MKGNPDIIAALNSLLAAEHAAFIQYDTHSRMCANWGYSKLVEYLTKRSNDEKEHAKELIDRILFLEGSPVFESLNTVNIGAEVIDMFPLDKEAEITAIADYAAAIELALAKNDYGTRKLLEHILEEEEGHLNEIEANITQINNSGIETYLGFQID